MTTYGGQRRQLQATLVFAAVNLLGSFIFLLSIAGTYRVIGRLAMAGVAERITHVDPKTSILVAMGFFVAFCVKSGLFPFHYWLPTLYAGPRPAVAAILSGAVANIGAYGLLRFGAGVFPEQLRLGAPALILLGAASIIYGGVLATSRGQTAEMLAYSAIGQVGYVLVAVGVGGAVGLSAAVLLSVVNALNKTYPIPTASSMPRRLATGPGVIAILASSVATEDAAIITFCMLGIAFVALTSPVSSHAIARAAARRDARHGAP